MAKQSMPTRRIASIVLALTLNACTMTLRISPPMPQEFQPLQPPTTDMFFYFSVPQYLMGAEGRKVPDMTQDTFDGIKNGLTEPRLFKDVIFISDPPEKGVFCKIAFVGKPMSRLQAAYLFASMQFSLLMIPFYADIPNFTINYDLYIDKKWKKRYQYGVSGTTIQWLGGILTPIDGYWEDDSTWVGNSFFIHLNPLHVGFDIGPVFKKTTMHFVSEARRDGFF